MHFGLLEAVEGTFLKIMCFCELSGRLPVEIKIAICWTYILGIWLYFGCLNLYFWCLNLYFWCRNLYRLFWVSELIFRVSELILWVSELISLVLGVWTYTFGHQRTKHSEDPWIWKYWRTKHCGMTCGSGNTEGSEPVDFRPISRPWAWNAWAPRPFGPGLVPC